MSEYYYISLISEDLAGLKTPVVMQSR